MVSTYTVLITLLNAFSAQLQFEQDLAITKMFSGEGEDVPFCETLYPVGNVEDWLLNVERVMKASLKQIIGQALQNYQKVRGITDWLCWMCVYCIPMEMYYDWCFDSGC